MHYYKRNLGDYAKKAGRLSMLQHGSYTLLIDACYDREQFPTLAEAIDWCWASSAAEIEAVEFVLRKFFVLEDGLYVQKRIQEEIAEYHAKAETNARIAQERETKRKEKSTNRAPVVDDVPPAQHEAPPNHEPVTSNHKPITKEDKGEKAPRASRLPQDFQPDLEFAREQGIANPENEAAQFADFWAAKPGKDGTKLDWPATWRTWCRNSRAKHPAQGIAIPARSSAANETFRERDSRLARERVKAFSPLVAASDPSDIFTLPEHPNAIAQSR